MPAAKTDWDKGEIQSCWQKMTALNSFWFIFSFKSSSYLMLDKPVARTMLAIYELSPTDILNLYLANVPSFFFFTSSFSAFVVTMLSLCSGYIEVQEHLGLG